MVGEIPRGQGVKGLRGQVKYTIITECLKFEKVVLETSNMEVRFV
jgi:hypothetical protein